jgi:anthranilate/para-aminobenzoate synthase component II
MKATFIDFDDSFSYNVVQELSLVGFEVTILSWLDFHEFPESDLLVLGPGPGHPDDYERIFPLIRDWQKEGRPLFGVCLGHQIFWRIHDEEVVRSKLPVHGQKVKLELTVEWRNWLKLPVNEVYVQRYNSLAVLSQAALRNPIYQNFLQDDEILITKGPRLLTYQFHPESIGTSFRKEFMSAVWGILKE